jgi:hypothetical protein
MGEQEPTGGNARVATAAEEKNNALGVLPLVLFVFAIIVYIDSLVEIRRLAKWSPEPIVDGVGFSHCGRCTLENVTCRIQQQG